MVQIIFCYTGKRAEDNAKCFVKRVREENPESLFTLYNGVIKSPAVRAYSVTGEKEAYAVFTGKPKLGERYKYDKITVSDVYFTPLQEITV